MFQTHKKSAALIDYKKNSILSNFDNSKSAFSRSSLLSVESKKSSIGKFINPKNSIFSIKKSVDYSDAGDPGSKLFDSDKTFQIEMNPLCKEKPIQGKNKNLLQKLLKTNQEMLPCYDFQKKNCSQKGNIDLSKYCKKIRTKSFFSITTLPNNNSIKLDKSRDKLISGIYSKDNLPLKTLIKQGIKLKERNKSNDDKNRNTSLNFKRNM